VERTKPSWCTTYNTLKVKNKASRMCLMKDALKAYAGVQVECTALSPHIPNLGTRRT